MSDYIKIPIRGLIPFKYKNICKLCEITQDQEKRGKFLGKKSFVLHEEFIDVYHKKNIFPQYKIVISSISYAYFWLNRMWEYQK